LRPAGIEKRQRADRSLAGGLVWFRVDARKAEGDPRGILGARAHALWLAHRTRRQEGAVGLGRLRASADRRQRGRPRNRATARFSKRGAALAFCATRSLGGSAFRRTRASVCLPRLPLRRI